MPLFTDALIGDTTHLSTEEFGAYCLLLITTWRNNGQPFADDDVRLARICRASLHVWRSRLRPVLSAFFDISDGKWRQKRLEKEWRRVTQNIETSRTNGRLGGRPKLLINNDTTKATCSPQENPERTRKKATHNHEPEEREGIPPVDPPLDDDQPDQKAAAPLRTKETGDDGRARQPRRRTKIPADWEPSTADRDFAIAKGLDPDYTAEEFRYFWIGSGEIKADWSATFRTRCLQIANPGTRGRVRSGSNGHEPPSFTRACFDLLRDLPDDGEPLHEFRPGWNQSH